MQIYKSILIKTILLYLAKGILILLRGQVFLRKHKTVVKVKFLTVRFV